jgi:hypothetical protein
MEVSENKATEANVLQDEPAEGCKATKEELLKSKKKNLDPYDYCPICERRGVLCEVANHPSAAGKSDYYN